MNVNENKKGYRPLEDVKDILIREIRNEKKGEIISKEMKGKTLSQLRSENFSVDTVSNINYNSPYAVSLGNEPAIFALATIEKENQLSNPINGNMGTFVFETINKFSLDRVYNEKEEIAMLQTRQQYALSSSGELRTIGLIGLVAIECSCSSGAFPAMGVMGPVAIERVSTCS